ncbi:hypothetical protein NDU88_006646 [Pleurodeles waltl]|uniref:Uncharacterized protein n=1 Tax=Pleurodeles waltl TaxID=8319 RepID=A0AAV7TZ49_PLEWA|nr:hypothetical protein NDU88_006646 [Pleurodeles waltl]
MDTIRCATRSRSSLHVTKETLPRKRLISTCLQRAPWPDFAIQSELRRGVLVPLTGWVHPHWFYPSCSGLLARASIYDRLAQMARSVDTAGILGCFIGLPLTARSCTCCLL